jgi:hypothetical protein
MSVITIETDSEVFNRMFDVQIRNYVKPLEFKMPTDSTVFSTIVVKIPNFYPCDVCCEMNAEIDLKFTAGAYICSKCQKEHVLECSMCHYPMIDLSENPDNYCDINDSRIKYNKTVRLNGKEQYICRNCFNRHISTCDFCNAELPITALKTVNHLVICEDCKNEHFKTCNSCHATFKKEELINGVCSACFIRANSLQPAQINGYSHKPRPVFISLSASGMLPYYGCEIEMDGGNRSDSYLRRLARFKEIYLKNDASLGRNGVELVTYPMNLEYHRNSMKWAEIFSICESDNYKSHDSQNCGLHIHVGRNAFGESDRNKSKYLAYFLRLFMKFKTQIAKFSRRTDFHYCEFYSGYRLSEKSTRAYQSYVYYNQSHRNLAVNFLNTNTVEIRVFRGTLNKLTFLAAIGLIDSLIKLALSVKTEEELNAIVWSDIRRNAIPELIAYLDKKGL